MTPYAVADPAGLRCMLMRGGTSKGAYFLAGDLPAASPARDDLLLRILGSPDERQVDGIGGGHPLTSKVAVVSTSDTPGADVDYLFLQVHVDRALVSASQPCGNILAGVAPFALERGLIAATGEVTEVRIRMVNTGSVATARLATPGGAVHYAGDTSISGVPFPAARIAITFEGTQGSVCGALLPTGRARDRIARLDVTCIDNGMPVVVINAADLGVTGYERPADLEANGDLRARLEELRFAAASRMGLGDAGELTIPKLTLVAAPRAGGTLCTRTFIPHRCHSSIGVLGAVTVATAARLPGSVAADVAVNPASVVDPAGRRVRLETPSGYFDTEVEPPNQDGSPGRIAVVRTARKLFDGRTWPRATAAAALSTVDVH